MSHPALPSHLYKENGVWKWTSEGRRVQMLQTSSGTSNHPLSPARLHNPGPTFQSSTYQKTYYQNTLNNIKYTRIHPLTQLYLWTSDEGGMWCLSCWTVCGWDHAVRQRMLLGSAPVPWGGQDSAKDAMERSGKCQNTMGWARQCRECCSCPAQALQCLHSVHGQHMCHCVCCDSGSISTEEPSCLPKDLVQTH